MSRKGKSVAADSRSVFGRRGREDVEGRWKRGLTVGKLKGNSWNDGKILKLNCGNGCTTLYKVF